MHDLSLPSATITAVINNPSALASPASLGISSSIANIVLIKGYIRGFRTLFILHAVLNALATVASVFMIKHKNLDRGDEQKLRKEARNVLAKGRHASDPEKAVESPVDVKSRELETIEKSK